MSKKLKLLFVTESMGGGVLSFLSSLTGELSKDFDIVIAHGHREETPKDLQSLFPENVKLIPVKAFTREISVRDIKALFELKKIAKEIKPDVIHLHSSKAGALGRLAFCFKKTPLYYTPHGYSFLMQDISKVKKNFYKILEMLLAKSRCVTVSCSLPEHLISQGFSKKIKCICNGIDVAGLDKFLNVTHSDDIFTVCTSGRITVAKNPALFNEIALSMPTAKFMWIGDGELKDKLTAPNITVTGWVEREKARELTSECDAFLLPSLWEGLSLSLLEAMYLKKPCIVSDIPANRAIIEHGVNGYICENIKDYCEIISTLFSSPNITIGENAHKTVAENYTLSIIVQKYKSLYRL